jgi:4-aminobutyrate aminotransferase-like enzyme
VNVESQLSPEEAEIGRRALLKGWSTGVEPELVMVRAEGASIWDADGNEYIDCTSQAWSNNIGASDPRVVEAASRQAADLTHLRSNYDSVPLLRLAKRLTELAPEGMNRVSFCLHGSLAIESAMKIALKNTPDAGAFITLRDGYHGRSFATMGASWAHSGRSFDRLYPQVVRVPQPYSYRYARSGESPVDVAERCLDELRDTIRRGVTGRPAAFIMEPVQGNGTQLDFPRAYYSGVREVCDEEGVLLIWDEIQTGFGRTGSFWASEHYGVVPDVLVFGKGIGGGFPLAGVLVRDGLEGFDPGDDALTFGQFPPSLAASLAAIQVLEDDDLLENCRRMGDHATTRLLELQTRHPLIGDVRCPGLLIGVELVLDRETKEPAVHETSEVYRRGIEAGVLFGTTRYAGLGNVVKIKPPLCITVEQLDSALDTFDRILTELEGERS